MEEAENSIMSASPIPAVRLRLASNKERGRQRQIVTAGPEDQKDYFVGMSQITTTTTAGVVACVTLKKS